MRVAFCLVLVLTACAPSALGPYAAGGPLRSATTSAPRELYVSDLEDSVVDIYSLPSLKLVRKLKNFFEPQGECTNAAGDVWIVDTGYQTIAEYAPGASKPMATLADDLGYPASCAVNPLNGDLAVVNEFAGSGPANVLIYVKATGTPESFRDTQQEVDDFAAYDDKGNLYVSGETVDYAYALSVLRAQTKTLTNMTVSGATLYDPGVVLWNDGTLILGDQECRGGTTSCLYATTVSGVTATVKSTLALGKSCDVAQVVLYQGELYGGNGNCARHRATVDAWSYPVGERKRAIVGVRAPIGAAVSGAPTGRL